MHVNRTEGYNTPGVPDGTPGLAKAGPEGGARKADPNGVALSESALAALVRQAAAADEVNSGAVADARRLLESGQLDTPEAIRRAAESILNRGV
ncbi:MAG: hypothetical protein FJ288_12295 [Planctomycetes bacterium]|nr:hypothetical protein [Planctomycetota bacterium]